MEPPPVVEKAATPEEPRVVLVTLDGVRWQDVYHGGNPSLVPNRELDAWADPENLLPNLYGLASSGVALGDDGAGCGVVRARGTSNVSLPGYIEILGGRATSCRSNACARGESPTVLDDAASLGIGPVASIASWDVLERAATNGSSSVLVSAGARAWPTTPPTNELAALVGLGMRAGPFPGPSASAYRPDDATERIALEYVRAHSPRLLHVGLGDTDEWAHRRSYFEYLRALHDADAFVGDLVAALERQGFMESTTVLVTTDHGRARDFASHGAGFPESRRAFVLAFGRGIAKRGSRCASRDIELVDVGETVRALLHMPLSVDDTTSGTPIEEIVGGPDSR